MLQLMSLVRSSKPLYSGHFSAHLITNTVSRSQSKISLGNDLFLADSAKIAVVKIIFHVLFLVLETGEKRK